MPASRYRGPPMALVNVRAHGPRMVFTTCGIIGAHARPNWQECQPQESLTGRQWRCETRF